MLNNVFCMVNKFDEVVDGDNVVLIFFLANWCPKCKKLRPVVDNVIKQLNGKVKLLIMDIESRECRHPRHIYKIKSAPTLMVTMQGQVRWRCTEYVNEEELMFYVKRWVYPY